MVLPQSLPLRPSASLTAILFLSHLLAATVLYPVGLPLLVKAGIAVILVLSTYVSIGRVRFRNGPHTLTLRSGAVVSLVARDGSETDLKPGAETFVSPWLVVLVGKKNGLRSAAQVLGRDSLGPDGHRVLRLWLRNFATRSDEV